VGGGLRRAFHAAAIGLLALVVGCGGGAQGSGPSSFPFSPFPTSPGPTGQAFDNGLPCPAATDPDVPAGSGCVTSIRADLDGDGSVDRFLVYARLGPGGMPDGWRARAVLASGPTPEVTLPTGAAVGGVPTIYPRVVAAADAAGGRSADVFVKLSSILFHVGGEHLIGIFGVQAGRVMPVTVAGRRLVFASGGISRYGDGALCSTEGGTAEFVVRHIEQTPPLSWKWTERAYRWQGLRLVPAGVRTGRLPISLTVADPKIVPFYELRCGDVRTS